MLGCWFGQRVFLMSAFELRSGHKLFGGLCLCLALAGWLCWLAGWAGWAGWLGWLGWLAGWLAIGSGRGRRLFAHVLGNIYMLVPRQASQEVEFASKPLFV